MRDISFKVSTLRTAKARAELRASASSLTAIKERRVPKGDPLEIAKASAVTAAKRTTDWIPYCHNIPIEFVDVRYELGEDSITIDVCIKTVAKTGVEMEAMTAAAAAALTIYDMLKMIDDEMEIASIQLLEKKGGKSDFVSEDVWTGAVLTVSDRAASGAYEDRSGPILVEGMLHRGASSVESQVVADEFESIRQQVRGWVHAKVDIVLVAGGTGIGPRDRTPEALEDLFDLKLPGVVEALRSYGQDRLHTAMFSRSSAGVIGSTLVVCIPGSPGACQDALNALFPALLHAKAMLAGGGHA